jgi:hypothetical protein
VICPFVGFGNIFTSLIKVSFTFKTDSNAIVSDPILLLLNGDTPCKLLIVFCGSVSLSGEV